MEAEEADRPIVPVPPPWKLKGTVYMMSFWSKAGDLPAHAYSPLERASAFASSGAHRGGLSQIQVIRYTESPVGPYDELILCPGFFSYERGNERGLGRRKTKKAPRITRIYVSQKYTCWNGRKNWNIPKHLAKFEWEDLPDGSTKVKVYPHDETGSNNNSGDDATTETLHTPSPRPLFQATFLPLRWAPAFPLSLSFLKYVGIDAGLVHPPLPAGRHGGDEEHHLPGTDRWCKVMPVQSTRRAVLGWMDMSQKEGDGNGDGNGGAMMATTSGVEPDHENFWPGLVRWHLAIKLEDADIEFGEGEYWDSPRTML
ncbi:hypothetical protein F4778DRAFT_755864 [Xylariomycetidae sp. FL2044]|nr:hypothetical protein F4778DRAFT_755864 [Xylariomycetidae sp. FL2044]